MTTKDISRRNFLRISGTAAALAAAGISLPQRLMAAPFGQDVTNIVFGGWGATAEDNGVQAAIQVFEQEHPEISVEWQITPASADYMQQLYTNFAAGTAPDTSFIGADVYASLQAQGVLLDITDKLKADPLLGQPNYFLEPQEENRCADANGRWNGIGACWVTPQIYYNAALFEEAGITPPGFKDDEIWDWDTFIANAKLLTVDANGKHPDDEGFDPDNIERWGVQWPLNLLFAGSMVFSNGGSAFADGKVALDSPEALEALQKVADLVYVHHVAPRTAAMADLGMSNSQMVDNGRLAMAVDGSWALAWLNPSSMSVPLGTGAIPMMKTPASIIEAHFHCAISTTQHPDEAWEWVRFLATPFYQTQFLKVGLWLPSQTELATPDGLKTWITEGIHPANYPDLVTDYLPKHGVAYRYPTGWIEANTNYITPAFQALEAGTPAAEAFPAAVQQANDAIAEASM